MKKTLIAASVAALVAAPAAFADVKIGGNVIQEFVTDSDQTGTSEDGLESAAAVDLVFSVSEDLGNGMSAFAKIHTLRDNGGSGNADQVVGLKGDFGTLTLGRMEDFSEGKVSSMGSISTVDALSIETNRTYKTGRSEGGIAYVSPSFNGLTFGVAGYAMANGGVAADAGTAVMTAYTSATDATTTTAIGSSAAVAKDADGNIDATDIMIEYANGPLLVRAAHEVMDKKATVAGASGQDQKTTTIGVNYKMDNITLKAVHFDVDNGRGTSTNDADGWIVGASVAMGANTFGVNYSKETDIDSNAVTTNDDKNMLISFSHALSKRTSINAAYRAQDDGTAGTADNDQYGIGIKHVF